MVQLEYENVYRKVQADPDNQRRDKWCSTVYLSSDVSKIYCFSYVNFWMFKYLW